MKERIVNGRIWRDHVAENYRSKFGKSTIDIKCPWCDYVVTAYVWSLSGSGKKCEYCGVMHYSGGESAKPMREKMVCLKCAEKHKLKDRFHASNFRSFQDLCQLCGKEAGLAEISVPRKILRAGGRTEQ